MVVLYSGTKIFVPEECSMKVYADRRGSGPGARERRRHLAFGHHQDLFGASAAYGSREDVGILDGAVSRFGRSFVGEPDAVAEDLSKDEAAHAADTLLVTIPDLLGVAENLRLLDNIAECVAPVLDWSRSR
jgi:alkanesulfonate monooxygenase SsuD/methylene tetrahydromethanopterin reductase-like flavin-dependent oxidoreductase (luciferase family)